MISTLFLPHKGSQTSNIGVFQREFLQLTLEIKALAFEVLLVLFLLLAPLVHVVLQQRGEPEPLVAGVAGEAGVAHHVHLQLVACLEGFGARVALELAFLLFDLFQL